MKIIKKIYGKIEFILYYYTSLIKIWILSKTQKKRMYLMGVPVHGNLGDQAIVISEREFLKDHFKEYKVIEVESSIVTKNIKFLKKVVGNSLLLIHGGGFIGTIWPKEDNMAKLIINNLTNNNIIMLPQTAFFDNDAAGKKLIEQNRKIYESHKKLHICVRETYSYNFMKENFKNCNIYLVPDMVLYSKPLERENENEKQITLCLRDDKEKTFSNVNLIVEKLKNKGHNDFNITDTVIERRLYEYNRIKKVNNKILEFNNSRLVVTDRLHGMVFALLANTPCLVINSKSYKVRGVYNWLNANKKIKLIDNMDSFDEAIDEILKEKSYFNSKEFEKEYDILTKLINDNIKNTN